MSDIKKTAEEITEYLTCNGFNFELFELENEHSAKNLIKGIEDYTATLRAENRQLKKDRLDGWKYDLIQFAEFYHAHMKRNPKASISEIWEAYLE